MARASDLRPVSGDSADLVRARIDRTSGLLHRARYRSAANDVVLQLVAVLTRARAQPLRHRLRLGAARNQPGVDDLRAASRLGLDPSASNGGRARNLQHYRDA